MNLFSCGNCGKSFVKNQGQIFADLENYQSFKCNSCIKEAK